MANIPGEKEQIQITTVHKRGYKVNKLTHEGILKLHNSGTGNYVNGYLDVGNKELVEFAGTPNSYIIRSYYDSKHNIPMANTEYRDGLKHGQRISWHHNGAVMSRISYSRGKQIGDLTSWHDNGQLCAIIEYDYELNRHGEFRDWHNNGTPRSHRYYVHGYLHGFDRSWDETGQLLECRSYTYGKHNN